MKTEADSATLLNQLKNLRFKADTARNEAEDLREQASDLDSDARDYEDKAEQIEAILRDRGELFDPEHAAQWGREVASAVFGGDAPRHVRMFESDWLTNGHMAWRVDAVPDGLKAETPRNLNEVTHEVGASAKHAIDLTSPVVSGESSGYGYTFSEFEVEGAGVVRFADRYWRAVQACGDEVAVTMPTRYLVSYRDGKPTAAAMRMRGGDER